MNWKLAWSVLSVALLAAATKIPAPWDMVVVGAVGLINHLLPSPLQAKLPAAIPPAVGILALFLGGTMAMAGVTLSSTSCHPNAVESGVATGVVSGGDAACDAGLAVQDPTLGVICVAVSDITPFIPLILQRRACLDGGCKGGAAGGLAPLGAAKLGAADGGK
jgi:hypothetical protein